MPGAPAFLRLPLAVAIHSWSAQSTFPHLHPHLLMCSPPPLGPIIRGVSLKDGKVEVCVQFLSLLPGSTATSGGTIGKSLECICS